MSKSDFIIFLFLIWITLTSVEAIKGYKIYLNPNCTVANNCTLNETKIVQVIVKQPNKTIHFLLPGNNPKAPLSVIMLEADANADQVSVNWTRFLSQSGGIAGSISLKGVRTSYGFIINEHMSGTGSMWESAEYLPEFGCPLNKGFCVYIDFKDSAVITPDDITRQCQHMLGKNLLWQLIVNANGQNPLKFVYTAVKSNDTWDTFNNVTVSVSTPLCIFVMLK
ncbi:unnamed protein product [Rodentolepis nana]|uniref:Reelin domain-containing protein n=1 Tax=Rodentolepis nana TaxID=102285 RepID=A0A0R3TCW6_RODNA|nr:unnamed protein product [Rodentolepis nana]